MARSRGQARSGATSLLVLALAVLACSVVLMRGAEAQQRVRKELRNLTPAEKAAFVTAVRTLFNTRLEDGQARFGPAFKDFRYFIVKHAVATNDQRGDQAHGAPCFMTFHRAWLLELEAAILSVSPSLGALPYWDLTRDLRGGDISRGSRNYIFSSNWFGNIDGNSRRRYAVSNGLFAGRVVPTFSPVRGHEGTTFIYSGSARTRRMRSEGNDNSSPFVTRLPTRRAVNSYRDTPFFDFIFYPDPRSNEMPINYNINDYYFCCDASRVTSWMAWTTCADMTTLVNAGASIEEQTNILANTRSPLLHVSPHWLVGGGDDRASGDFDDVSSAPNEFALFIVHHTNIDRQNMIWQRAALALDPTARDRAWGFPTGFFEYPNGWEGCWVDDVLTSNFGFTDIFPGAAPANAAGFTHREVLFYTDPDRTPYTYENMNNPFNPLGKRRELLHEGGDKEFKWPTEFLKRKRSEEVEKQVLEAYKGTSAYKHWKRFANRRRSSNGTRHL